MATITETLPDNMPEWAQKAFDKGEFFKAALERVAELEDFAIWMTGCGYEFTQHEHFCEQRDKLLK